MSPEGAGRSASARDLLALAVLAAALYLPALGGRDLWNPNEPIYGLAVREMADRGDWLVPTVNGQVFGEKPILYYWIARASSAVAGGVSETSLRVPSALAGLATVLLAYALVVPYAGRRRGALAALLTATTFGVFWNARFVQMDILVAATTLGTIVPGVAVLDGRLSGAAGWSLAGIAAGLGFLAKGPVGWVCPGIAIGLYAVTTGRLRELVRPALAAGVATALAVAAPWYVALGLTGHTDVLHEVLIRQNFSRFVQAWDHAEPWWYYLKYLWIDGAPWSFLLPLALALPGRDPDAVRLDRLCWGWLAGILVFFSLSDSKRSAYALPAMPAAAILASAVLERALAGSLPVLRARALAVLGALSGATLLAAGAFLLMRGPAVAAPIAGPVRATGVVALASGLAILAALALRRRAAPHVAIAAFAAVFLGASVAALPAANVYKSARGFCAEVARAAGPDEVVSYALWRWRSEYVFYLGRPVRNLVSIEDLRAACDGDRRVLVIVERDHRDEVRALLGTDPIASASIGEGETFLFSSR